MIDRWTADLHNTKHLLHALNCDLQWRCYRKINDCFTLSAHSTTPTYSCTSWRGNGKETIKIHINGETTRQMRLWFRINFSSRYSSNINSYYWLQQEQLVIMLNCSRIIISVYSASIRTSIYIFMYVIKLHWKRMKIYVSASTGFRRLALIDVIEFM